MNHADVIVIGGSAAGIPAAISCRRRYPEKSVLVVRKEKQVLIPCGIPYILGCIGSPEKNLIPDATSKSSLKYLVTIQKGIFDLGIKHGLKLAKKKSRIKEASLFSVTPWDLHGYISYNVQENSTVRNVLYDPANPPRSKKKRLRPPHRR